MPCYLSLTGGGTASLAGWLVEPGLDPSLPVLVEVVVGQDVVTFADHFDFGPLFQSLKLGINSLVAQLNNR